MSSIQNVWVRGTINYVYLKKFQFIVWLLHLRDEHRYLLKAQLCVGLALLGFTYYFQSFQTIWFSNKMLSLSTHQQTNLSRGYCRRGVKNYWLGRCLSSGRWASPNIVSVVAVTWPKYSALLRCPPNICFSRLLLGCLINLH